MKSLIAQHHSTSASSDLVMSGVFVELRGRTADEPLTRWVG
jgi:hypothetical protein